MKNVMKLAGAATLAMGLGVGEAQACGGDRDCPSPGGSTTFINNNNLNVDKSRVDNSVNINNSVRNTDNSVRATGGEGGQGGRSDVDVNVGPVSGGNSYSHSSSQGGTGIGGAGGQGGQGGQGGFGQGGAGGNATGGQGGVGQGGIGQGGAGGNATGGTATTGASSSNNDNNISYNSTYKHQAAAYAPSVVLAPSGNCGSGVSLSFGLVAATGGAGYAWQGEKCLTTKAAEYLVGVGLYNKDAGVAALGIATLNELYESFRNAMAVVGPNLENCPQAGTVSAVLLAKPDLDCNKVDQHLRPAIQTVAVAPQMFEEPRRVRRAPAPSPRAIQVPAEEFCRPLTEPLRAQLQECRAGGNITMAPTNP